MPSRIDDIKDESQFVALTNETAYYSDRETMPFIQIQVIGKNTEQVAGWISKRMKGYGPQPFKIFKMVPVTIQHSVTVNVDEQA